MKKKTTWLAFVLVGLLLCHTTQLAAQETENTEPGKKVQFGLTLENGFSINNEYLRDLDGLGHFLDRLKYRHPSYSWGMGGVLNYKPTSFAGLQTTVFFQQITLNARESDEYMNYCCKYTLPVGYFDPYHNTYTLRHYYLGLDLLPFMQVRNFFAGTGINLSGLAAGRTVTVFEEEDAIHKNFSNTSIFNTSYTYGGYTNNAVRPYNPGYMLQWILQTGYTGPLFKKNVGISLSYRRTLNHIGPDIIWPIEDTGITFLNRTRSILSIKTSLFF